jgi:hypothetical protein
MSAYSDVAGERFGKLVAFKKLRKGVWLCRCNCGGQVPVRVRDLRQGTARDCGNCRRLA